MQKAFTQTGPISVPFIVFCCVGAVNALVDFFVFSLGIWVGVSNDRQLPFQLLRQHGMDVQSGGKRRGAIDALCLGFFLLFVLKKIDFRGYGRLSAVSVVYAHFKLLRLQGVGIQGKAL